MKVNIAGYNIDKSLIDSLPNQNIATPETISAAYARISRSQKSVTELRDQALGEVEKARTSNESIIFDMGHSSVAEHAVYNIDLIGVSRFLTEFIQRSRLASFTEKSQRYVTLKGDYIVPEEIEGTELETEFNNIIEKQNELYSSLYKLGKKHLEETGFEGALRELQGRAKEDARYVLALATKTQMGMTINARSLAVLLRRLDRLDLLEAKQLKEAIEVQVKEITPSLVRYTDATDFERKLHACLPDIGELSYKDGIELLGHSNHPEESIIATMAFEKTGYDAVLLLNWVKNLSQDEKEGIFYELFNKMSGHNSTPRAFEVAHFTLQMSMSSSCFGQLKRHRMSTIVRSDYDPKRGYVVPPLLTELKANEQIARVMKEVHELYYKLEEKKKGLGSYILTNGHKLAVIFQANLRELYHFSRLRSDCHAQWEIREVSMQIDEIIRAKVPLAAKFMMGKDKFEKCNK